MHNVFWIGLGLIVPKMAVESVMALLLMRGPRSAREIERQTPQTIDVRRSVQETVSREPWRTSNPSYGRERRADGFVR